MRVANICTRFNRISETFIYDLVLGLERAGVENHVLTAARVNAAERPFARVEVLPLSLWDKASFVLRKHLLGVYEFPLPHRATRRALKKIAPEVILAHFGGVGAAIAPAASEMGIPLVVVFHAFDLFTRPFTSATYKTLFKSGAHAVTVSEHGRRRLLELGCPPERTRVIHCGVDIDRFAEPEDAPPPQKGLRLVTVGRFVEKKGFHDLIQAVARIRKRIPGRVSLDIWGDGPLKEDLIGSAFRSGLRNVVAFRGVTAAEDIPQLLRHYDAFVLPSRTARDGNAEGTPITILEAQAAGIPVVTSLHAGIPEAIPTENHELLAREGDSEDLAKKLMLLSSRRDQWRETGMRGRKWVMQHFTLRDEMDAFHRLFLEATASPATRTANSRKDIASRSGDNARCTDGSLPASRAEGAL